jgi:uncharacterized protein YdiU (UPF0061 family)
MKATDTQYHEARLRAETNRKRFSDVYNDQTREALAQRLGTALYATTGKELTNCEGRVIHGVAEDTDNRMVSFQHCSNEQITNWFLRLPQEQQDIIFNWYRKYQDGQLMKLMGDSIGMADYGGYGGTIGIDKKLLSSIWDQ